jgi:hypothetical protein
LGIETPFQLLGVSIAISFKYHFIFEGRFMAGGTASPHKTRVAERRNEAMRLRQSGESYRAIAEKMSKTYPKYNESQAFKDIKAVLCNLNQETDQTAHEYVSLELERYDQYLIALSQKIQAGEVPAINTAIAISERRCKLLGLDAPIQVRIQEGVAAGVEAELRQFLDGLEAVLDRETFIKVLRAINSLQTLSAEAGSD